MAQKQVPNNPLTGVELAKYAVFVLKYCCETRGVLRPWDIECACEFLRTALDNDCYFSALVAYRNPSFEIAARFHMCGIKQAFMIEPSFHFVNPSCPEHKPFVRRPHEPPLDDLDGDCVVDCFTVKVDTVSNPNLVRVRCGMPITVIDKIPPAPGDVTARFVPTPVEYDAADYPELPEPVIVSETEHYLSLWGIGERTTAPLTTTAEDVTIVRHMSRRDAKKLAKKLGAAE